MGRFFIYFCRARYEDAKFFYEQDTRKRLKDFRSQLKGILFHVSYFVYIYSDLEMVLLLELFSDVYSFFIKLELRISVLPHLLT